MIKTQDLVYEVLKKAAISKMLVAFPFLNIPVIKQIFTFFTDKLLDKFYETLKEKQAFFIIDFKTQRELNEYNDALNELETTLGTTNDEGKINEARENFEKRLGDLISFRD